MQLHPAGPLERSMPPSSAPLSVVFESSSRAAARERRLVLVAIGMRAWLDRGPTGWRVSVQPQDESAAAAELRDYESEATAERAKHVPPLPVGPAAVAGVIGYAAVLIGIAAMSFSPASAAGWLAAGQMDVGLVRDGQLWRPITALTLHADFGHLLSNVVFGGFYGLLIGQLWGGGVAWVAIWVTGVAGNLATTAFRDFNHTSIGASTAVFGALGLLVADGARHSWRSGSTLSLFNKRWKQLAPLVLGLVIFSMTGLEGARTDVGAHVAGFLAGLVLGGAVSGLNRERLHSTRVQLAAATLAGAGLIGAWGAAALMNVKR